MRLSEIGDGVYFLDTGWGCSGLAITNGRLNRKNTAPIFRKLFGVSYLLKEAIQHLPI